MRPDIEGIKARGYIESDMGAADYYILEDTEFDALLAYVEQLERNILAALEDSCPNA